jgi:hypothetical protein
MQTGSDLGCMIDELVCSELENKEPANESCYVEAHDINVYHFCGLASAFDDSRERGK